MLRHGLMVSASSNNDPIDALFKKQVCAELTQTDKQDYYFGSYSHFYIHEEMLKD